MYYLEELHANLHCFWFILGHFAFVSFEDGDADDASIGQFDVLRPGERVLIILVNYTVPNTDMQKK